MQLHLVSFLITKGIRLMPALKETVLEPALKTCRKGAKTLEVKYVKSQRAWRRCKPSLQTYSWSRGSGFTRNANLSGQSLKKESSTHTQNQYFCPLQPPHRRLLLSIQIQFSLPQKSGPCRGESCRH